MRSRPGAFRLGTGESTSGARQVSRWCACESSGRFEKTLGALVSVAAAMRTASLRDAVAFGALSTYETGLAKPRASMIWSVLLPGVSRNEIQPSFRIFPIPAFLLSLLLLTRKLAYANQRKQRVSIYPARSTAPSSPFYPFCSSPASGWPPRSARCHTGTHKGAQGGCQAHGGYGIDCSAGGVWRVVRGGR